ncbi:phosphatases II [Fomitiporia mediterranea MF3/22]|uniref:phosphatases II n=1 Tax=Fomitiporia mediterranea (strain MF3/22) TaxID=694068 RepID=UPI0004408266|nr:phosphatases II [Fomitiporia mediterranea MF3/22]EJD05680.1 phosphatases II [Fomitiporia mediterranea MF3/22]
MDAIKVAKVEAVKCRRAGRATSGTLHLTAHHLIFDDDEKTEDEEWIPYPMISLVTRMPMTLQGYYPLSIHQRNFRSVMLYFQRDAESQDVFESIRGLTVASSVTQLYAFFYAPSPPLEGKGGWSLYSPRDEFARMGIGSRSKAWRFTDINKDYSFCPTYPARLVVPTRISDTTLQYASKYRSKCRIPTLVYLHWANYGTITRSSQPMVGITNNRSIQDEKLIEAIFQSHHSPESRVSTGPVYGATSTNLIIDARPTTNAMANVAKGAGTENMEYYKEGKKAYLGIDNIHVMRESLSKVVEALRSADALAYGGDDSDYQRSTSNPVLLDRQALRRSGWLRHLSAILDGTLLIVRNIHVNSSHVLIHCSDGWDRTAQLSSLAQLCLDPFYRTYRGFQVLVEKDWLSFGHRFLDRCGHLSSEKFFISATDMPSGSGGAEAAQALFASVQNRLVGQGHLKETSPVFHQFLECVRQIQRQNPGRFEFNSRFLERIHYHLYSCQFGTFLFNCERERRLGDNASPPCERTLSVWDFLNSPAEVKENTNPLYDPKLDDPSRRDAQANMGVLFPDPKDVRFWNELYGRTDEEMNGKLVAADIQGVDVIGPVEGMEDDPIPLPTDATPSSGMHQAPANHITSSSSPSRSSSPAITLTSSEALSGEVTPKRPTQSSPSRALTSSMTNLVQQRPETTRQDSFRPFSASPSNVSLKPGSPSRNEPTDAAVRETIPARGRTSAQQAEFIPEGVRSIWGKFSSNATAAFSAVQGAYGGMSKEIKNITATQGWDGTRGLGGELESRTRTPGVHDEADWTTPSSTPISTPLRRESTLTPSWAADANVPSERWRNDHRKPSLSNLSLENPWRTQPREIRSPARHVDDISSSSVWAEDTRQSPKSLPPDPTVLPVGTAQVPSPSRNNPVHVNPEDKSSSPEVALSKTTKDGDPLGVL